MLTDNDAQKDFFNELVTIKNAINQQIPLAANRFEEFECPPVGEPQHDIDIQFYLHESLQVLMKLHFLALDELREAYHTFTLDNNLQPGALLPITERLKLERFLTTRTSGLYSKLEHIWRLRETFDDISFEAAKPKLLEIINSLLPKLCDRGEDALVIDEQRLIDVFLEQLRVKVHLITEKIINNDTLTKEELKSVDRFRREDVPQEDEINQFFSDLSYNQHFPDKKKVISTATALLFLNDAKHNIDKLEEKLRAPKHLYSERYRAQERLIEIRQTISSNLTTTGLDTFLESFEISDIDKISVKSIKSLEKGFYLQTGLYHEQHLCNSGYCHEHACLALVKLLQNSKMSGHRIEKVSISYEDTDGHGFIVIDRAEVSELDNMTTWGEKAILFDAWHQLVCYASDLNEQGRQYSSFPKAASWSSIEFKPKDKELLSQLSSMNVCYTATGNIDPEKRESRIIEEYGLKDEESKAMLFSYLEYVVDKYRPANFRYKIKFYTFSTGYDLVKFIPGFCEPVVAIHEATIALLAERKLSLTAIEFAIATILMQLQMYTNFISPISISHQSIQQIDMEAMTLIQSTEASIEYLRTAAGFSPNKKSGRLFTVNSYERDLAGFNLKYVTDFSYLERIKVLQANIAAGVVNSISKDIAYPSPEFLEFLALKKAPKINSLHFFKISRVAEESYTHPVTLVEINSKESSSSSADALMPISPQIAESSNTSPEAHEPVISAEKQVENTIISSQEKRILILEQLIEQLPELNIELLPYELYKAPSIRLREFADIVRALEVDYNNPIEAALVDKLIDEAQQLKLPCFEYIYYAFASRWGVSNIGFTTIRYTRKNPPEYNENEYYILRNSDNSWSVFYVDVDNIHHDVNIAEIDELETFLNSLPDNTQLSDHSIKIRFLLSQYQKLRQLGFFKSIQQAITAFTEATTYEEAFERATALDELKNKYKEHLSDLSPKCNKNKPISERFFGTELGKKIKWVGFDLSSTESESNPPYNRFIEWMKKDTTGILATTLFRMGLSNHASVITDLPPSQLDYFSKLYNYSSCVFWGRLTGSHASYYRYNSFNELPIWFKECQSRSHLMNDAMFLDPKLTFEEAFIQFFDANLPALIRPDLAFNAHHEVQNRLLNEFYRIACEGSKSEKAVVTSFFFGREDKRDLKNLLLVSEQSTSVRFDSSYAKFICLQVFDDNKHHLFDEYDIKKLFDLSYIYTDSYEGHEITFESYRILLRLPEELPLDELFYSLLASSKEKKLELEETIINRFLIEAGQLTIFSTIVNTILENYRPIIDITYLAGTIKQALNAAQWPSLTKTQLNHMSIDVLIQQYILFDTNTIFPSRKIKSQFGQLILDRIMALPAAEQTSYYELWLSNENRTVPLSDIPLKNTLIDNLVENYTRIYGKDNGTEAYYNNISPLVIKLLKNLFNRDIKPLMTKLLTSIEAQKKLSEHIGIYADPADYNLFTSKRYKAMRQSLVTLIKVANLFSKNEYHKKAFLDFISAALSQSNLDTMLQYVEDNIDIQELSQLMGWTLYDYDGNRKDEKFKTNERITSLLMTLYYQFWDCSLYERAAIIEQVLIPSSQLISIELQKEAYELGLAYISQKLFPQAHDTTSDDYLAFCIMKAYLQTADKYMRSYLLTAMLVSANENMGQEGSICKKFASVCEHMGPAYVKLAQAIHSHPKTSSEVRDDLAHVKGKANPPHRWSLWRQISEVLPFDEFARIKRLGKLLGSASYNLALEVILDDDSTVVLLLLREDAERSARKGFKHIRATIDACEHPTVTNQRVILGQTIDEAARLSKNEMNKEASDEQSRLAQALYPKEMGFNLEGKEVQLTIKAANILSSGNGYRFIDMMHGEEFNSLPDATPEERLIKRAVAKAVVTMELHNIFRGGQFDSDRHGNQLRVMIAPSDSEDNNAPLCITIGLYDFGEMALEEPKPEELRQLADVISNAYTSLYYDRNMDKMISERIDLAAASHESTHYLMRLRKAFLAMHDFNRYLDKEDLIDILGVVSSKRDIHTLFKWPLKSLAVISSGASYIDNTVSQVTNILTRAGIFSNDKNQLAKELEHYVIYGSL